MMNNNNLRIGFVGLGAMGLPMAKVLVKNLKCKLIVFDTRSQVNSAAASWGAEACASPADVAAKSDVVITMLPDDSAVQAVACGPGGIIESARPGLVVMDFSTIGPWTIQSVNDRLAPKGVKVHGGAVTLGVKAAIEGTLAVYLDDTAAENAELARIVGGFSSSIVSTAGLGSSKVIKLINNLLVGVNVAATAEAVALAEKAGLSASVLVPLILKGSGNSYALANHIAGALKGDLGVGKFGVDYILKDLDLAFELAKRNEHTNFFGTLGMSAYRGAKALGYGANYYPVVLRWMEHAAGQDAVEIKQIKERVAS